MAGAADGGWWLQLCMAGRRVKSKMFTAVSATSITVKSADGFSKTYQVVSSTNVDAQRNGISTVKTGHQVMVTATDGGSTATATSILDFNLLPAMHGGGGWNHSAPPSAPPATGVG